MTRYDIAQVWANSIESTEQVTVQWVVSEVKKLFPDCRVKLTNYPEQLLSLTCLYKATIDKLNKQDLEVWTWVKVQMMMQGWEPEPYFPPLYNGNTNHASPSDHFFDVTRFRRRQNI